MPGSTGNPDALRFVHMNPRRGCPDLRPCSSLWWRRPVPAKNVIRLARPFFLELTTHTFVR
jgi:hypothetical protein